MLTLAKLPPDNAPSSAVSPIAVLAAGQSPFEMPPRFTLILNGPAALRTARLASASRAGGCSRISQRSPCSPYSPSSQSSQYSTEADNAAAAGPLVRITDLPAPNSGHIRILELNRPAARNAISRALLYALRDEIDAVHAQYDPATGDEIPSPSWNKRFGGVAGADEKGPTRALILASAVDTSFCAGADLKERKTFTQDE